MDCVFFTELGENIGLNDGIMYVSTNNGTSWTELDTFASRDLDNDEYLYLEHQLDLFGYLCNGQNYYSISVITQELNYLTWKEAFTCLSDEGLPDQLRAMYCDLIITMFVDISDNHSVVDRIKLSYIYNDVDNEHNVTDNSDSLTYKYFGELSQWISGFLSRNGDMIASLIGKNMLVKQVLRLVDYLVLFGFYGRFEDIETLLKPLMSLLDGRNDMPYPECRGKAAKHMLHVFRTSERFKQSPETKAIVEAKIQALEMLDLFLNFVMSIRLEKFISLFKTTNSQGGKTELSLLMYDDFDLQKIHVQGLDENLALEDDSAAKAGMKKLHKIFDDTSFLRKYNVVEILLDLSHYEYDDMVRKSMHLLNRFYSAHNNLFKRAVQAQVLITDTSMGVYNKTQELLRSMKRLAANKLTDETAHKLAEILDELIWFCHLDDEEEEPHFMNQNILYNNGIIEDIFTVISKQIDVKLLDQYTGLRQVFQKAFILLKMLARDNKIVQQRLFDRLDMLLSTQGAACELAEALTEVFTGNDKTCMKIAQHHVQKIMALVAQHTTKVPQFLDLLNAVVKVEELDLPLKRNQGFVMTYFMQFRSEIAFLIDQDEAAREAVLTTTNSHEQNYLIATVDLLATCAEGENRFIESICQTIFKIPKLLKVLNNPNISDNLKRPFLRFFLWVYLNTASGMIESGAGDIPHDPAMWGYLTSLSGTLAMVTDFSRNNSDDVKQLLKKAPGKTYREITDLQITRPADLVDPCVDKRDAVRGSLHYLFDAVMPFLQVFCRSYYKVDTALYPNEPEDMDSLTRNFKGCLEVIAPLVSKERQMTNLISCMGVLFASSSLSRESEEFHAKYGDGLRPQDVRSDARQEYEKYFEKEEHLNHQLNVFAVNMKSAYGGVNDVQTQIGYPSKKPYSEIDGDEELPLGPDFQAHINSFINPAGHTGLDKYKMAQKLIKALAISATLTNLNEKEKIEQVNLDIRCMQLLRGMLHNEIVKLPADFENDVTGCRKQLKLIEECQNALNHHNAIPATLEHLSRPQDSIVQELLAFLSCILFNGNGNVQSSMYAYFTDTFKEVFFFSIKNRITLSSIATRERRHLHAMHQAKMDEKKFNRPMTAMAGIDTAQKGDTRAASTPIDRPTSNTLHVKGALPLLNGLEMRGLVKGSQMSFGSRFSVPGTNRVGPIPDTERAPSGPVSTIPAFQFKDDGYIELVLRVLGLMCDNQHEDLQNYLREQPDNIKSVNLIAETTKFLNIIYSNISSDSIALITQVFDILVEFTSGNAINQSVVFDNKICDYINHILRVGVYKDCKDEEIYQLKCSIAILIRCLTEEMPDIDDADTNQQSNVPTEVMVYLDTEVLVNIMTEAFEAAQATVDVDRWNVLTNVGFQYYHLLRRKFDLDPNIVTLDSIKTPESQVPLEFYEGGTLSVEIVKDDVLQKLYFRVKDKNALRDEIKQKLNYEVDRSSPSNKIRDFMDWSSDIIKEIKYQRRGKSNPIGRVLVDAWLPLNYLVMLLTLAITILLMASWEAGPDTQPLYQPSYRWTKAKAGIYVLSGIHNFLSLAIFLSYAISNRPTFPAFGNIINMFRKQSGDEDTGEKAWNDKHGESHLEVKAFGFKSIYYVIFLACSAAGTATDGYFFAFHLLHIAEMNQLLKRVIQAVTTNGKSLMLVGLLGLAVLYIYALILFAFYRGTFWQAADGHQCTTIYECFVSIIHHGLSDTTYNQFAGSMTDHFPEAIGITFFDVSFFIIITTIGLNIVFGIIVDTFSQLRDAKWKIDRDMQNNCFICGRESYDFERHGKGFQKHVKDEHNQWAYLFFFIHLDETRPNDYSALELYVYKRLLQSNFDFFPLNRAMCLENEDDNVEKKVDYLVAKMKEQDADREREKEKQRQIAWEAKHRGRQST